MNFDLLFTYILGLLIAFCAGFVVAVVAGIWKDSQHDKDRTSKKG